MAQDEKSARESDGTPLSAAQPSLSPMLHVASSEPSVTGGVGGESIFTASDASDSPLTEAYIRSPWRTHTPSTKSDGRILVSDLDSSASYALARLQLVTRRLGIRMQLSCPSRLMGRERAGEEWWRFGWLGVGPTRRS